MKNEKTITRKEQISTRNLLTVDQVCNHLQISKSTFSKWRLTGRGPRYRRLPNGSIRVEQAALEEWITDLPESEIL